MIDPTQFLTPAWAVAAGVAWILKKVRDADLRRAVEQASDAAVAQAVAEGPVASLDHLLVRVAEILGHPGVPVSLRLSRAARIRAARAAIARCGLVAVQRVHVNPDGSIVPETRVVGVNR